MTELEHPFDYVIGLDNGVSANGIAVLGPNNFVRYEKLPTIKELSYQKEEHNITRIDTPALEKLFVSLNLPADKTVVVFERPMVNPARFRASVSAVRALEAELIVIERLNYRLQYVDSKQWQRVLLPDIEGSDELKAASLALGKKLYPNLILKKDADSLLIAHWAMNKDKLEPQPKPKIKKQL